MSLVSFDLSDFLVRELLLDAFVQRHLISLRCQASFLHDLQQLGLHLFDDMSILGVVDEIVTLLGIKLDVLELRLVFVG